MKSATKLKQIHKRIELLKSQRSLAWVDWHKLNEISEKTKQESKDFSSLSNLITSLTYEIRGLQRSYKDAVDEVVHEIVNS